MAEKPAAWSRWPKLWAVHSPMPWLENSNCPGCGDSRSDTRGCGLCRVGPIPEIWKRLSISGGVSWLGGGGALVAWLDVPPLGTSPRCENLPLAGRNPGRQDLVPA